MPILSTCHFEQNKLTPQQVKIQLNPLNSVIMCLASVTVNTSGKVKTLSHNTNHIQNSPEYKNGVKILRLNAAYRKIYQQRPASVRSKEQESGVFTCIR